MGCDRATESVNRNFPAERTQRTAGGWDTLVGLLLAACGTSQHRATRHQPLGISQ